MAITVASLKAQFTADTAGFEAALKRAADSSDRLASALDASGDRAAGSFDSTTTKAVAFGNVLSGIVTRGVGLLAQGFSSAISAGASFGETLNRIQAVGGASADQLAVINQKALELGAKLPISAQEGADGMLALVAGGMSVEQALSAVDGVAGFAAAQMLDVGSAAEIVSASLTSFGLGADKASFAADVMSQVANASAASVQDWGESIKYVGPVAGALKQPIEDMGVAIGLMANQSIKGSSAGTALRTILTSLAAPSKAVSEVLNDLGIETTNAAGQMLPFIDIATQMRSGMSQMTDIQKANVAELIAGKEGMSGFLAIVNAAPGDFDKMKQSMASAQGATEEFAKATNKGFAFEWGQLEGSIETVLIQGFQAVEPVLSSLTGVATGFVNALGGGLVAIGPAIAGIASNIQFYVTALTAAAQGQESFGAVLGPVGDILDSIAPAFGSLASDIGFYSQALMAAATGQETFGAVLGPVGDAIDQVTSAFAGLMSGGALDSTFMTLSSAVNNARGNLAAIAEVVSGVLVSAFQSFGGIAVAVLDGLPGILQPLSGIFNTLNSVVGGILVSAFQALGQIAQSVLGALPSLAQTVMGVLGSLASLVATVLYQAFSTIAPIAQSVFQGIATVVQMAMPGVMSLASAVGSLLVAAFNALQAIAISVFSAIQPYIPAVQAAIGSLAAAIGGVLGSAFQTAANFVTGTVVPALTNLGAWLADNLPGAIQALANFWTGTLQPAIASVAGWITGTLFPALGELFGWLQAQLPGALQALANFWTGSLQPAIVQVAGWVTGTLFPMFGELVNWLSSTLTGALQTLSDFWGQHGDTILTTAQTTWEAIQSVIDAVFGTITGLWQAFQSAREGDWTGFGEKLRAIWDASWEAIKNVILAAWPVIVQTAANIVTGIQEKFTSIDWHQIGVNIIEGIGAGISSMANSLAQKAAAVARAAKDAITGFFDMQSPSRVMADVGVNVMAGLEAGLDAGLPGVITTAVGGMRSLLEQINTVLDGIGGAISNSRFEKFRDAASALADGLTAISDAAKLFSGAGMAALSSVADKIRTFALDAKALLVSIDLSGIGAISNEKFEQFAAGLKELASGMASIASIGATFSDKVQMPNLRALTDRIRLLVMDALALLAAIDVVVPVIGETLAARLKALGEAASGAKSVAENAFGLIKILADTLAFDFGGVDWSTAYHNLIGLARAALIYVQALDPVTLVVSDELIAKLRSLGDGVGAVKAIAENTFGLIKVLVDTLAFDFGAPDWSRAWHNLMGLMQAAITYADAALRLADTFTGVVSGAATELGKALQLTVGIIQNAFDMLTFLEDVEVPLTPFLYLLVKLGQVIPLASRVSEAFLLIASQFTGIVTVAATELGKALALAVGTIRDALTVITGLAEADISGWVAIPLISFMVKIGQIIPLASNIASMVMELASRFTGQVTPAAEELGRAVSGTLGIVKNSLELITFFNEALANGPIDMTTADIHAELADALTTYIIGVADAFLIAAAGFAGEVSEAAQALVDASGMAVGVVTDAYDALMAFNEMLVNGPLDMTTADIHAELADALTTYIAGLTIAFLTAAESFAGEVTDAARALRDGAGMAVGVVIDAYDALLAFNEILVGGPLDMTTADIHAELVDALTTYISGVAAAFLFVANEFTGEVTDAARALRDGAAMAIGVVEDALDALTLFNAALLDGPVDMTGADIHAELVDALTTYAVGIATAFLLVANTFDGIVSDAAKALGDAMGEAAGVVKEVLDFSELHQAIVDFRGFDMSIIGPKLALIFGAAVAIAQEFGRRANASGIKEAWVEAGAALASLFGDAASTLKDALDLGAALLDPETQIPSIGQIQGKVDALFNIIQGVAAQFAARASAAASAGMNFEQVGSFADTVKSVFEGIREVAAAIADFTGVSLGASGFNNISQVLNAVFTLFEQVAGRASVVNQVSAAIASVLGGLANLVDAQAYQAGVDIGTRIADGIAAGLSGAVGVIGASIITAANTTAAPGLSQGTTVATGGAGGGGGGSVTYVYNTDNSKNITVSQVINTTSENVGKAAGGMYPLLAGF